MSEYYINRGNTPPNRGSTLSLWRTWDEVGT